MELQIDNGTTIILKNYNIGIIKNNFESHQLFEIDLGIDIIIINNLKGRNITINLFKSTLIIIIASENNLICLKGNAEFLSETQVVDFTMKNKFIDLHRSVNTGKLLPTNSADDCWSFFNENQFINLDNYIHESK